MDEPVQVVRCAFSSEEGLEHEGDMKVLVSCSVRAKPVRLVSRAGGGQDRASLIGRGRGCHHGMIP